MKILICNDTENNYHYGCSATSLAIKNELAKYGDIIYSHTVFESWNNKYYPNDILEFDCPKLLNKWILANKKLVKKIELADVCVINGEGTIHGFPERIGTQNLLFLAYILKKHFNKKVYIINHSCFPIYSLYDELNEICDIYYKVYSILDFIAVRDMYSLAILNKIGINCVLAFDCLPLYITNCFNEVENKISKEYILINGGATFFRDFKCFLKNDLKKYYKFGKKIIFLMSSTDVLAHDDLLCINEINKYNKKIRNKFHNIEIYWAKNVDEWLTIIKNSNFLLSGRFHHSIAAKCFGVPYVCFESNTPKNNVLEDIGNLDQLVYLSKKNFLPFYNEDKKYE